MSKQEMEQLVAEYGDDLYRFCIHLTGNSDLADDLYQSVVVGESPVVVHVVAVVGRDPDLAVLPFDCSDPELMAVDHPA